MSDNSPESLLKSLEGYASSYQSDGSGGDPGALPSDAPLPLLVLLGALSKGHDALAKQIEHVASVVGPMSETVIILKEQGEQRSEQLKQVNTRFDGLEEKVDGLNDVDAKLKDVGIQPDDAPEHRRDHLWLRSERKSKQNRNAIFRNVFWGAVAMALVALASAFGSDLAKWFFTYMGWL